MPSFRHIVLREKAIVMMQKNRQPAPRRSRWWATPGLAIAAVGLLALSACADNTTEQTSSGSDSSTTLGISDAGEFNGLVTGSSTIAPTVDGDKVTIDLGGQKVTVDKDKKLKVGFFVVGSSSPFFQTAYAWGKAQADAYGYDFEMVDASFDASKQADQIQTAISTKKYDAIIIIPVDGVASCDSLTKQAPQAGIIVVNYFNPICGKDDAPIENWYVPGLLGAVGGGTSVPVTEAFAEKVMSEFPEGKGMSLNIAESICVCGLIFNKALDGAQADYPNVDLSRLYASSTDAAGGQTVTEQYLKDNKDADFILALSDDTAAGAVEAVKAAGLTGKVKVFIAGGTQQIVDFMKVGASDGTYPYYMGDAVQSSLLMLHEAVAGNPVPTVIANDGHPLESYSQQEAPYFTYVTPEIINSGAYVANTVANANAR